MLITKISSILLGEGLSKELYGSLKPVLRKKIINWQVFELKLEIYKVKTKFMLRVWILQI